MAYSTIPKSTSYFNTKLYTGDGEPAGNAITGVGFQPDWVWIKERSSTSSNSLFDAVRGATKNISSNLTSAEATESDSLLSFDSDGFTVGANNGVNEPPQTYASWNWKANGSGSSNTDGTITSTVSANTTSGFSIVSYTGNGSSGATVGHGLGSAPKMIILKELNNATDWFVYHNGIGATKYLSLNDADAAVTTAAAWNDTAPSSSVFTLGNGTDLNGSSDNYIAYCFAEKQGFSKFGSYEGNGNADGVFIYTVFKPAFAIIKSYNTAARNCTIQDNKRSSVGGPNPNDKWLYTNSSEAEYDAASNPMDFVSNGFKLRNTGSYQNQNAYIYMAFGQPIVSTNGVIATAR